MCENSFVFLSASLQKYSTKRAIYGNKWQAFSSLHIIFMINFFLRNRLEGECEWVYVCDYLRRYIRSINVKLYTVAVCGIQSRSVFFCKSSFLFSRIIKLICVFSPFIVLSLRKNGGIK